MNPIRVAIRSVDDRLFNDAFRRAWVHGRELKNGGASNRLAMSMEALRRERTVAPQSLLERTEPGRFVGGITGRSGTTWLTRLMRFLLDERYDVIGEQGLFVLSMVRAAPYEYYQFGGSEAGRRQYLNYFYTMIARWAYKRRRIYGGGLRGPIRYIPRRAIDISWRLLVEELQELHDFGDIEVAFGRFYTRLLDYRAAVIFGRPTSWVSKEPPYGRHADELLRMVPEGRLVVLGRDGRQIALSMYKRGWRPTIRGCMERWAAFTESTLDAMGRAPAEKVMLVRYDRLVENFEEVLPEVFRFLELPSPDMDSLLRAGHGELIPQSDSLDRWKKEISATDLDWFNESYGDLMERLGYRK